MEEWAIKFVKWIEGNENEVYRQIAGNPPGNQNYEQAKIAIQIRHHREVVKIAKWSTFSALLGTVVGSILTLVAMAIAK